MKALQDQNRVWVGDQETLERLVIEYYALLCTDDTPDSQFCISGVGEPVLM